METCNVPQIFVASGIVNEEKPFVAYPFLSFADSKPRCLTFPSYFFFFFYLNILLWKQTITFHRIVWKMA